MSTKIIDNSLETTDYDVGGYLQCTGKNITYEKFMSDSGKSKVKMCVQMSNQEAKDFWNNWHKGVLTVDPKAYGLAIRDIRQSSMAILKGGSY